MVLQPCSERFARPSPEVFVVSTGSRAGVSVSRKRGVQSDQSGLTGMSLGGSVRRERRDWVAAAEDMNNRECGEGTES